MKFRQAVDLKKNQSTLTRKFRDLLHIAGMGSSLGVGFNPGSPDTIIPNLIIMEIDELFYNQTGNLNGFNPGSPDPRQQAAAEGEQAQGLVVVHLMVNIIINYLHLCPTIPQSYNRYTGSAQQQGSDILEATTHHIKV